MSQESQTQKREVPIDLFQLGTIAKYEFLNFRRSRRFLLLLVLSLVAGASITGIVAYFQPKSWLVSPLGFYVDWTGYSLQFMVVVLGVFFGDAISSEFEYKTGYSMVGNPLTRPTLYLGKYLAAFSASLIALALYQLIAVLNVLYYFGWNVPAVFLESSGFAILALASVVSIAFFASSLLKNGSLAVLGTAGVLLFAFNIVARVIENYASSEPWYLLNYGASIMLIIYANPYPPHSISAPTILEGIVIMVGYLVISMVAGLLIFQRREFN